MSNDMLERVLVVSTRSITQEKFLVPTVNEFLKENIDVVVACSGAASLTGLYQCPRGKEVQLKNIELPTTWQQLLNPIFMYRIVKTLRKLFQDNQKCTIHVHTPVAAHISRLANIRLSNFIVYHVHGFRFQNKWNGLKNILSYLIEKALSNFTDKYILINRDDEKVVLEDFKKKCCFVPGVGVNVSALLSLQYNKDKIKKNSDKTIVVGVVSAFKIEKGYDDIINVARKLKDNNVVFHCYGSGDYGFIKRKANKFGLNNILFKGFDNCVVNRMKDFDLFLHPSRREGLPVSIMESMCLGVPVVATNIRGCRDLISDLENGHLYEPGDILALEKIIIKFINNPDEFYSLAQRAQLDCKNNYDSEYLSKEIVSAVLSSN